MKAGEKAGVAEAEALEVGVGEAEIGEAVEVGIGEVAAGAGACVPPKQLEYG